MKPTMLIAGAVLFFLATRGGEQASNIAHGRTVRAEDTVSKQVAREERNAARRVARMADVSLDRVQSGCIAVGRPQESGNPSMGVIEGTILIEGMTVTDWNGMPFADGTLVCTSHNTGVVMGGVVTQVAQVAAEDRAEYLRIFGELQ